MWKRSGTHARTHTNKSGTHTHHDKTKEGSWVGREGEGTANSHTQRTDGRSAGSRRRQPYLVLLR